MNYMEINYLALLACGISAVVLGMLWFGPIFGRMWRSSLGISDAEVALAKADPAMNRKMMRSSLIAFVFALVMAYVLTHIITFGNVYMQMSGVGGGLQGAFWSWLGFVLPVLLGAVLWENKTMKWLTITASYYLVLLLVMGAILGGWM